MGTRVMNEFSHSSAPSISRQDDNSEHSTRHDQSQRANEYEYEIQRRMLSNTEAQSYSQIEQIQKLGGLSIGFCSIFAEQLLSHPCIVLRRQCQVHHAGAWYHLTPFSLLQSVINIQRTQGGLVLWKGLGGVYIVRGLGILSESVLSEVTTFPRDVNRHSSLKKYGGHLLLKSAVFALSTPFYAASLIETVQSDIASEKPGMFDVLYEGVARIGSWGAPKTSRQIAVWHLAPPTVIFRLAHYVVSSIAQFTVTSAMQLEQQEIRSQPGENGREPTAYEVYFPELLASFTGGILADMITYPLETVLHRLYVQGTRTIIDNTDTGLGVIPIITGYKGFLDCFRAIIAEEGIPGLYRGFGALVMQYAIHAAILRVVMFMFEKLSNEIRRRQDKNRLVTRLSLEDKYKASQEVDYVSDASNSGSQESIQEDLQSSSSGKVHWKVSELNDKSSTLANSLEDIRLMEESPSDKDKVQSLPNSSQKSNHSTAEEKTTEELAVEERMAKETNVEEKTARESNEEEKTARESNEEEKTARESNEEEKTARESNEEEKTASDSNEKEKIAIESSEREKNTKELIAEEKTAKESNVEEKATKDSVVEGKSAKDNLSHKTSKSEVKAKPTKGIIRHIFFNNLPTDDEHHEGLPTRKKSLKKSSSIDYLEHRSHKHTTSTSKKDEEEFIAKKNEETPEDPELEEEDLTESNSSESLNTSYGKDSLMNFIREKAQHLNRLLQSPEEGTSPKETKEKESKYGPGHLDVTKDTLHVPAVGSDEKILSIVSSRELHLTEDALREMAHKGDSSEEGTQGSDLHDAESDSMTPLDLEALLKMANVSVISSDSDPDFDDQEAKN